MKKEQYLEARKGLLAEAQALLDDGKLEDFQAKTAEVDALDQRYETEAKAQANLDALTDKRSGADISGAAVSVNGRVVATMGKEAGDEDIYDSGEYKRAFMNYVCRGTPMPERFRNADANTKTGDAGVIIPTHTVQKIYEAMENTGMILPLVTHTTFPGGVTVPTSSAKPAATWVNEGNGSDRQKKAIGGITFPYHKLRCAISISYEVANMAYPVFEAQFVQNVAEAMVKAKETAIISGSGTGQPKGILKETAAGTVSIAKAAHISYKDLCAAEAAEEDEGALWAMTKKTYMNEIEGMTDENGQPVARVTYGLNGKPQYYILGRRVVIVNSDYMNSFAGTVAADSVVAFLYNFHDYIFNEGVAMTVKPYVDEETDDTVIKAIEICDGKSVRNTSLVTVVQKGTA